MTPPRWRRTVAPASFGLQKFFQTRWRAAALTTLTLLLMLLAIFQRLRFPDDSICQTEEASKHSWLCGTTTRVCIDHVSAPTPRPLAVIAAGATRASSTWLFNALRILMRIRDPNTVSGWHLDLHKLYDSYARYMQRGNLTLDKELGSRMDAFRSLGSVLIKVHDVVDWHEFNGGGNADTAMSPYVDAVFTSHRDLRTKIRSVRGMGWGVLTPPAKLMHPDFCKKRNVKQLPIFLRKGQYKNPSTWVNMAQSTLLCRERLLESAGDKLKMDVKSEDIAHMGLAETVEVLRKMGQHLDYKFRQTELEMAAHELSRLRAPPCDGGSDFEMDLNPVTHLHKGHIQLDKSNLAQAVDHRGMRAIEEDPSLAKWLRQHGYKVPL